MAMSPPNAALALPAEGRVAWLAELRADIVPAERLRDMLFREVGYDRRASALRYPTRRQPLLQGPVVPQLERAPGLKLPPI
jgi:hypothetical protein